MEYGYAITRVQFSWDDNDDDDDNYDNYLYPYNVRLMMDAEYLPSLAWVTDHNENTEKMLKWLMSDFKKETESG